MALTGWRGIFLAFMEHKVPLSPKQQGIAAGFAHTAEEKAVESGLRAHGDKL